jgi:hypothetical protein
MGHKRTFWPSVAMSALPPKADIQKRLSHVCFVPIAPKAPTTTRFVDGTRFVLRQERGRTPSIVRITPFSYLVGLPDVYRAFILIAHADRQTTSQGSELRPYNWDISVEGERWQSRSCWRYSRRKKWEGLSSNSHWWSTLFGKSPCLALYDRQVAELRNQLYQR